MNRRDIFEGAWWTCQLVLLAGLAAVYAAGTLPLWAFVAVQAFEAIVAVHIWRLALS